MQELTAASKYRPGLQARHRFAPMPETEPFGHGVHESADPKEYVPLVQDLHDKWFRANCPAGQALHVVAPAADHVPVGQLLHVLPSQNHPTLHLLSRRSVIH